MTDRRLTDNSQWLIAVWQITANDWSLSRTADYYLYNCNWLISKYTTLAHHVQTVTMMAMMAMLAWLWSILILVDENQEKTTWQQTKARWGGETSALLEMDGYLIGKKTAHRLPQLGEWAWQGGKGRLQEWIVITEKESLQTSHFTSLTLLVYFYRKNSCSLKDRDLVGLYRFLDGSAGIDRNNISTSELVDTQWTQDRVLDKIKLLASTDSW